MQVEDSSTTVPANLSPVQAQVIAALAQGRTVTAAAQNAGLQLGPRASIQNRCQRSLISKSLAKSVGKRRQGLHER